MVAQEKEVDALMVDAADKEMAEQDKKLQDGQAAAAEEPMSSLFSSMLSIDAKTPRQAYFEQVEAESDVTLKEALVNLFESGFNDFKVNKMLMLRLKDVNAVANQLLSGALSES